MCSLWITFSAYLCNITDCYYISLMYCYAYGSYTEREGFSKMHSHSKCINTAVQNKNVISKRSGH